MVSSHNDDQALIPIGEAAKLLGVSINTLRRWDNMGHFTAFRTVQGHRRYRRADVEALVGADAEHSEAAS